jgi:hypothetical protein
VRSRSFVFEPDDFVASEIALVLALSTYPQPHAIKALQVPAGFVITAGVGAIVFGYGAITPIAAVQTTTTPATAQRRSLTNAISETPLSIE